MIRYPDIDKVAVSLGPLQVHWYGLMYVFGFITAFMLLRYRANRENSGWSKEAPEDLVFFGMIGLFVGARLFYMFVYGFDQLKENPLSILKVWEGGMSFHGGLIGVMVAMWWYARKHQRGFFEITDFLVPAIPPGLFFGRMGNFINGELWGKTTDVPWAFYYDGTAREDVAAAFADGQARHPSQLYEAGLEGLVLFLILWAYSSKRRPTMAVSGMFLFLYGIFRFIVEFIRLPDSHMGEGGYLAFGWLTTGQLLTAPMVLLGLALIVIAYRRGAAPLQAESKTT
ncbi:MAG: prolipoprotein diacylglyceryl transferase [Gammaproteobacteria bacterium]|nr:prolipoprotein diacylglyceryl transferase [Gammaproteobacteria bacterium]NNF60738.1 prolipoprotein diacylglyceryl transferase [Gammaproteobacteria bacterium]NNM20251.1 prolipoprotein diacylglyceryl transferase [Gammaproteobacteria bacterium]